VSDYARMLDLLTEQAGAALGIPATRDPSQVPALVASESRGCVLVGFPTSMGRLMGGPNLDVPLSLIAPAPADLATADWLLEYVDALLEFAQAGQTINRPVDIWDSTYPAVTVTARIAMEVSP
jgi:hypothetical protein